MTSYLVVHEPYDHSAFKQFDLISAGTTPTSLTLATLPSPPTRTSLLIGHLPLEGGVCGSLLGGVGDGRGPLVGRGSVFHRLGGQGCAFGPTQIDLIGRDWRHRVEEEKQRSGH